MVKNIRRGLLNAKQLFTAFSFYRLQGSDLRFFQYVYPTLLTVLMLVAYRVLSDGVIVIKLSEVVGSTTALMGVLVGFYIAALAAVTSFPNESLNSVMVGDAPKIRERAGNDRQPVTRRRFLSILLGYCAFLSIFIYALGSVYASVSLAASVDVRVVAILTTVWWGFYTWISCSLLVVTMLCLHYLIDRMHRA